MNTSRNYEASHVPAPWGQGVLSFWLQPSYLAAGAQRETLRDSLGVIVPADKFLQPIISK